MPEFEQKKSGKGANCRLMPPLLLCGALICAVLFCCWLLLERYNAAHAADEAAHIRLDNLAAEKDKLEKLLALNPCEAAAQYKTMQNNPEN